MTQQELVEMLKALNAKQAETIKCLRVELEEAQAVNREQKSTQRVITNALGIAKGGLQVRRETQSDFEMLRLALQGLLSTIHKNESEAEAMEQNAAINFAHKILTLTEKEAF